MNRRLLASLMSLVVGLGSNVGYAAFVDDSQLRIAGIVLKWVRGEKETNFSRFEPLVRRAARKGAEVVCSTERFMDGYGIDDKSIPPTELRASGASITATP